MVAGGCIGARPSGMGAARGVPHPTVPPRAATVPSRDGAASGPGPTRLERIL